MPIFALAHQPRKTTESDCLGLTIFFVVVMSIYTAIIFLPAQMERIEFTVKDAFHNSLVSNFRIAFKFIEKENITDKYLTSAAELIDSSKKISKLLNNDFVAIFSIYND